MLLVSLLCIIAIFVLTRTLFGLRHVQLVLAQRPEESAVAHLRAWLREIPNDRLRYQILVFPEDLLKLTDHDVSSAEVFLADILPSSVTGKVIYLNNDVIVQADIAGLLAVPVLPHTFGAFLIDTHSASKHADPADKPLYALHVNMMNRYGCQCQSNVVVGLALVLPL
ncbi:glycosyltransferase 8 domain-containing protein 1-like [Pollicipes pollicipes]|uniref:glycosyltransferase 8 domain-containing protein 1-like n=1 Tax=Pollicipes pollicipes TaxID=41117 RepID=UPI001884A002|nr:glycosyltransferase 8 domain-containing protein 1-like [Pollicipes pollicipes]